MKTYTLYISDGMSRDGGGSKTTIRRSITSARAAWRDWALAGYYQCDGDDGATAVDVAGSIYVGEERVADMSITALK